MVLKHLVRKRQICKLYHEIKRSAYDMKPGTDWLWLKHKFIPTYD